ncbi:MAG: sulfite exporter TauE/SafE family protein [Pseudomonadota bacterium]
MLTFSYTLLITAGVVAGLMAGLLGIGGGIVLVPVLVVWLEASGVDPAVSTHIAIATALTTMLATAPASASSHHRRGAIDWSRIQRWGLPIAIGAASGALLARYISGSALRLLFSGLAALIGTRMLLGSTSSFRLPPSADRASIPSGIGLLSAWLGIGGGSFSVPLLTGFGLPVRRAVGTSALLGLFIAVPAVIGYVVGGSGVALRPPQTLGYLHWPAALLLGVTAALFAPVGAALAHRVSPAGLKRLFGAFLIAAAIRLLISVL